HVRRDAAKADRLVAREDRGLELVVEDRLLALRDAHPLADEPRDVRDGHPEERLRVGVDLEIDPRSVRLRRGARRRVMHVEDERRVRLDLAPEAARIVTASETAPEDGEVAD